MANELSGAPTDHADPGMLESIGASLPDVAELIAEVSALTPFAADFAALVEQGFALTPLALFVGGAAAAFAGARLLVIVAAGALAYHLALQHGILAAPVEWAQPLFILFAAFGVMHGVLALLLGDDGGSQAFLLFLGGVLLFLLVRPLRLLRALAPQPRSNPVDRGRR